MSTEKIDDAVHEHTEEELAAAKAQLAEETARAQQLSNDLAKAAIEGERGKIIDKHERDLAQCQTEIAELRAQIAALLAAKTEPRSEPIPPKQPDPPLPPVPEKAPIMEPETKKPESEVPTSRDNPDPPRPRHRWM